jgi:hypothetical protein
VTVNAVAGPPSVSIATPADGANYSQGQAVNAAYSCQESTSGPGLQSTGGCTGTVSDGAKIDTSAPGAHSFAVTATSQDGQTKYHEHQLHGRGDTVGDDQLAGHSRDLHPRRDSNDELLLRGRRVRSRDRLVHGLKRSQRHQRTAGHLDDRQSHLHGDRDQQGRADQYASATRDVAVIDVSPARESLRGRDSMTRRRPGMGRRLTDLALDQPAES